MIEEMIFYPACKPHAEKDILDEAYVEHDGAKVLIAELSQGSPDDHVYGAKVKVLSELIKHHVREEKRPKGGTSLRHASPASTWSKLAKSSRC